jgi:hypothetical protein
MVSPASQRRRRIDRVGYDSDPSRLRVALAQKLSRCRRRDRDPSHTVAHVPKGRRKSRDAAGGNVGIVHPNHEGKPEEHRRRDGEGGIREAVRV